MIKRYEDFTMFLVTFKQARKLGRFKYIEIFQFELFSSTHFQTFRSTFDPFLRAETRLSIKKH